MGRNELHVNDHCKLFQNSHLAHPVRAVELACSAMQVWDWSYMVRDAQMGDGYEKIGRATCFGPFKARLFGLR